MMNSSLSKRHVGNLAWALLRKKVQSAEGKVNETEEEALVKKAIDSILEHCTNTVTLFVHLHINPKSTIRRRHSDHKNQERLPMTNEESECSELHGLLDVGVRKNIKAFEKMGIPTLVIENSHDGEGCLRDTTETIVTFILSNTWRCAMQCQE